MNHKVPSREPLEVLPDSQVDQGLVIKVGYGCRMFQLALSKRSKTKRVARCKARGIVAQGRDW